MNISLYTISTIRQIPSATTVLLLKQLLIPFCNANFIEFQRGSSLMAYINQILYSSELSRRSVTNSSFVCFSKRCFKRQQRDLKTDQQLFKSLLTFCSTSCLTNNICIYLFFFSIYLFLQLFITFCVANFIQFQGWSSLMVYINQILYFSELQRRSVTNSSFVCFWKICFKRQQRDLKTDHQLFKSL